MHEKSCMSVMTRNTKFKPKAGYVYVVTNECLKPVKAKGVFRGRMVKAVKIGNAKDFTNRLGSLNTAVYENFDFHLGVKTDDVVGLEGLIHTALQDYRIYTRDGDETEFFACPLDEVIARIKNLIARSHKMDVEEYKGGKVIGRSGAKIRANIKRHEAAKAKVVKSAHKNTVREVQDAARRGPFRFSMCGIGVGAEVVFVGNESKKAVVVDDRHVRFANETTSLSALAKQLLGCSHPVQGTMYFTYNGKILDDIRKERERN